MKKIYTYRVLLICSLTLSLIFFRNDLNAQCVNADFSDGNFTGWTGTYFDQCTSSFFGSCLCSATNPLADAGFNQGPLNDPPTDPNTEYSQVICSAAGGNDPNLTSLGFTLPTVWPGNAYSARIGNMWQDVGSTGYGDGETISYSFTVTPANCNFTYHYAVVLYDGGHPTGQQPFFNIAMVDGSGNAITCANYEVDATTAHTIGGFTSLAGDVYAKPWTSVFIPLNNYLGQTVKITFTTRGCLPSGCAGSHYSYAYIAAECGPLALVASSPTVCGGTDITLTAPAGAATYAWSGPGIVSGGTTQTVTIDQPGPYSVTMTTFGNTPCTFTLDTIAPANPHNPGANFSATNACVGATTRFTDLSTPVGQIATWAWDFGGGNTANTQNPTYTFPSAGTYPVKLTISWPPCTADTTINVVVSPPPVSTFTVTSPVCEGTNSNITYTGGAPATDTYTWNFSGGTIASGSGQGPYQVNWSTGGNQTVTLVVSAGSCSSPPSQQVVVVNPFPGLIAPPDTSVCTGGSVTLVASGANTYTWAPPTGLSATNTASVVATPATATIYTVTGSNASCNGTAFVTVAVNPTPTSTFTTTSPVCEGQNSTITYTGNAGPGANYVWNFNGGTATPAGGQGPIGVNWNVSGAQAITLTVFQSGCSSPQTPGSVLVDPYPTSTFTVTSPVCTDSNSTIVYTGNAGPAGNYTWNFAGGQITTTPGSDTILCKWSIAGTENLSLSVSQNGCTSPVTTATVIVNPIPTSTFNAFPLFLCSGDTTTLTYTGTGTNNATYNWTFGNGNVTPGGTVRGPQQVWWTVGGVDTVTLTVSENGCTSPPDTQVITNQVTPTSPFTVVTPVCVGSPSLTTYTGDGITTDVYKWFYDGGVFAATANPDAFNITWNTPGVKFDTLVVSSSGCTSPPTIQQVDVIAIPTATFTATSPLCAGFPGTINYTGSSTMGAILTWSGDFSTGNPNPAGGRGPIQVSWNTAGVYSMILNVNDSGCIALPDTVPVTVYPIPVSDAGAPVAYCSGQSATIGGADSVGYAYSWSPPTGLSSPTSNNPTVSLTNTANSILTQKYVVTTTSNQCISSDSVIVTVNPVPVALFTPPAPACLGNSFEFKVAGTHLPTATFAWSFGNFAVPATSIADSQTVTYTSATTSSITLTITQTSTACVDSITHPLTVYPIPQALVAPDTLHGCPNLEVCFLNNSVSVNPSVYTWDFGDGNTSADSAPCNNYADTGVYYPYFKITSAQGCSDSAYLDSIKVIPNPIAAFTPSATVVLQPASEIDFTNQSLFSVTYLWNYSSVGVNNAVIGSSTDVNPVYNFTQYGLYNVMLYAYNAYLCVDSTQQPITVLPPNPFFIPNAFTPNGDGKNDEFFVDLQEGATLRSMRIFDRSGEKVFDGLGSWDGTYKGKPCPPNVYVYEITIHLDTAPGDLLRKGSVTLIR
jgi:gliding motility-associated-like protein